MAWSSDQDATGNRDDHFNLDKFYSLLDDQEKKKGSTFQRVDNSEDDYFDRITKNLEASKQRINSSSKDALTDTDNDNASNFDLNKF